MNNIVPPQDPPERGIRVLTTHRLTKLAYTVIDTPDLPYTVLVVRAGIRYRDLSPLWDELDAPALLAWCTPWGLTPTQNPWDHVDPNRIAHPDDIPAEHRLPAPMEDAIHALI